MTVSEKTLANAIRALSMDAVQAANSGHPGMPMGMADVATVLFREYLKFDPAQPKWADRDRFILSAGHGSMLIYSLLHLTGYARPTMDDIRNFRQLGSPCAGHPENFELEGIETTTGPLGQGLAMAVGMAIAERHLNASFGDGIVDHRTWVVAGDGCLMEGINHEAIGLAGHLGLGRLIVLWDDNKITIDGAVSLSSSEDVPARYAGMTRLIFARRSMPQSPIRVPRWSSARRRSAMARRTRAERRAFMAPRWAMPKWLLRGSSSGGTARRSSFPKMSPPNGRRPERAAMQFAPLGKISSQVTRKKTNFYAVCRANCQPMMAPPVTSPR
jgi:transketolase N-terminal domain/subunit